MAAKEVVMPALGVAMSEGVILRWLVSSGDHVARGAILAEIETDKTNLELESPVTGRVGTLLFAEGAAVPVGTPIVTIVETNGGPEEPGP